MRIILNDEELDVTLENEKTLGDVYRSLHEWMSQVGLQPLTMSVDGDDREIADFSSWSPIEIESIDSLVLTAGTINELRTNQLMTTLDYLNLIVQLFTRRLGGENLADEYRAALAEFPHVRSALPQLMSMSDESFAEDFALLDQSAARIMAAADSGADAAEADLSDFKFRIEQIRILLLDRLQEVSDPAKELTAIAVILEGMIPELEEAGISLQTGKEREAYNLVFRLSEVTAKLIRLVDGVSVETPGIISEGLMSQIGKIGEVVTEINKTIADEDQVLLADLLEYDLREVLESLIEEIRALRLGER